MSAETPFETCLYCKAVCKFRKPATVITSSQMKFVIDVLANMRDGMFGNVAKLTMVKAAETMKKPFNPTSGAQRSLANCIVAILTDELDMTSNMKKLVMKNLQKTFLYMYKKAKKLEESGQIEIPKSQSVEKTSTNDIDQDRLKAQRAALRAETLGTSTPQKQPQKREKKRKSRKSKKASIRKEAGDQVQAPTSTARNIWNWLKEDKKFAGIIAPKGIKKISNGFLINFDPDSEGYLSRIKIEFAEKKVQGSDGELKNIVKMRWISSYDVKYNLDVAIAWRTRGKIMAASFYDGIPADPREIFEVMAETANQTVSDWDPLVIILNTDKRIKKMVAKNIPMDSPAPGKIPDIHVPITIVRSGNNLNIVLKCYADVNSKPSKIFGVMETIAEDLDNLYEMDESIRMKTAKDSGLFDFSVTEKKSFDDFHFLGPSEAIEVKTCPNCGRPFPDPDAEYRRCPNCLYKLM